MLPGEVLFNWESKVYKFVTQVLFEIEVLEKVHAIKSDGEKGTSVL
jgi:hypothetical protein